MPRQSERFSKARRVRHRDQFKRVFDFSFRLKGRYATVLVAPNEAGIARLGIVASRKLGDAVRRNRAKRLIRELFDAVYSSLESDLRGTIKRGAARFPATAHVAR